MVASTSPSDHLPCVVQLGFAGSRRLFDLPLDQSNSESALHDQVQAYLLEKLLSLPLELQLSDNHFLCCISQVAIGADMLLTRACQALNIPQRIFLPQHRDAYLSAVGAQNQPDFSEIQREESLKLLASPHVIQSRLVSEAADRTTRFEDTNQEILRVSDVVICLLRHGAEGQSGGTNDMLKLAQSVGKPTLEIRVAVRDGKLEFNEQWHGKSNFEMPKLPEEIARLSAPHVHHPSQLPTVAQYCEVVKNHVSERALRYSRWFSWAALVIIGTHILGTLLATIVLAFHPSYSALFLLCELALLVTGLMVHRWLHHSHPSQLWALARLLAEINRSVRALGDIHLYLQYLFWLRLPDNVRSLLRTLNVLHLRSTREFHAESGEHWLLHREAYLRNRLIDPDPAQGQIAYYKFQRQKHSRAMSRATRMFAICSVVAILASLCEFVVLSTTPNHAQTSASSHTEPESDQLVEQASEVGHVLNTGELTTRFLGLLAVVLPVLAVGALSWAAAQDYHARVTTFGEMVDFLEQQRDRIQRVSSARQLQRLVVETESRLLGETAEWYNRRSFTGVA